MSQFLAAFPQIFADPMAYLLIVAGTIIASFLAAFPA